jgi:serine/threonine protein kinase
METVASRVSVGGGGGSVVGTLAWKAPETFRGRYSEASDIFAMAGERQHQCEVQHEAAVCRHLTLCQSSIRVQREALYAGI